MDQFLIQELYEMPNVPKELRRYRDDHGNRVGEECPKCFRDYLMLRGAGTAAPVLYCPGCNWHSYPTLAPEEPETNSIPKIPAEVPRVPGTRPVCSIDLELLRRATTLLLRFAEIVEATYAHDASGARTNEPNPTPASTTTDCLLDHEQELQEVLGLLQTWQPKKE